MVGFARLIRPTYAEANVGHPLYWTPKVRHGGQGKLGTLSGHNGETDEEAVEKL
jgi:hypothetical protein